MRCELAQQKYLCISMGLFSIADLASQREMVCHDDQAEGGNERYT